MSGVALAAELPRLLRAVDDFLEEFTASVRQTLQQQQQQAAAAAARARVAAVAAVVIGSAGRVPPSSSSGRRQRRPVERQRQQAAGSGTETEGNSGSSDSELGRDCSGRPIRRRRSKLPHRSQALLRDWLQAHVHHPYPSVGERRQLAEQARLSPQQVQNWFTNTRKRWWAPWQQQQQRGSA